MIPLNLGNADPELEQSRAALGELVSMTPTRAAFESAWEDTPVGATARIWSQRELEAQTSKKIPAKDANEQFPGLGFAEDVNPYVAQMMYDRKQHREKLGRISAAAPDNLYGTLSTFAASSLAHIADPVNFGAGLVIGIGAGAAGLMGEGVAAGNAFRIASGLSTAESLGVNVAAKSAGRIFGQSVAENFAGNLLGDVPNMYASKLDGKEYDAGEALLMNAVTSLAFAGLHTGIHALTRPMNEKLSNNMVKAAAGAAEGGGNPKVAAELYRAHLTAETSGTHIPFVHEGFNPLTPHYSSGVNNLEFKDAQINHMDARPGKGITLTDNPNAAHGAAARAESDVTGNVFTHDISQLSILDGHGPIPDVVRPEIEHIVGMKTGDATIKDVMDVIERKIEDGELEVSAYAEVEKAIEAAGFDGHQYSIDKVLSEDHAKQTMVKVYDKAKVEAVSTRLADTGAVGKIAPEKLSKIAERSQRPLNDLSDPVELKKIDAAKDTPAPKATEQIATAENDLKTMKGAAEFEAHLDAEDIKLLESADQKISRAKAMQGFVDKSLSCFMGG